VSSYSWPHYWFGFFRTSSKHCNNSELPPMSDFQSRTRQPPDIDKILIYLEKSPIISASPSIPIHCTHCNDYTYDPGSYQYDGKWLWPCTLKHNVEAHDVVLPDELLNHIRRRKHIYINKIDFDYLDLPWPKSILNYSI